MPLLSFAFFFIGMVIGIVGCLIPVIIISRMRNKSIFEEVKNKLGSDMRLLEERHSVAESELIKVKNELQYYQDKFNESNIAVSTAAKQSQMYEQQVVELKNRINEREQKSDEQNRTISRLSSELSESKAQLADEQKHNEEKLKLLEQARNQLSIEFKNIANIIFDEKTKRFSEQNKSNLDLILNPLKEQLGEFRRKVEEVYVNESKDRHALAEHIKILTDLNNQVSRETVNLTKALKGENKTQGNWGEMILERALELSGLKNGCEYETQTSYKDEDGRRYIPDVIVHLPDNKDIVVDSKVTLVAYEKSVNSTDEKEQEKALEEHLSAIQNHINLLSNKAYNSLPGIKTLDFVLMFMPIEAAFVAAIRKDPSLFEYAFRKRIIIVSPSTLLVTLRTVQNIWQNEYQNRNTQQIVQKAADLYDKFAGFTETLLDVKKSISSASDSCEKAIKQLAQGKGNITGRIESFRNMGISPKKQIPQQLLELDNDEMVTGNMDELEV